MGGRHNASTRPQTRRIPVMPPTAIRVVAYSASRLISEKGSTQPYGSDDSHISLDLLDHRIQPSAQHLLGETEGESLDGVER